MGTLLSWARRFGSGKTVELVCPHELDPTASVSGSTLIQLENCLAECRFALPFELLALGVSRVVIRGDSCPSGRTPALLERWSSAAHALGISGLEIIDLFPDEALVAPVYRECEMPTSTRRGLLGLLRPPEDGAVWEPDESATEHRRLRAAVRTLAGVQATPPDLGGSEPEVVFDIPDSPGAGLVLAAENCQLAGVCVTACPEGALAFSPDNGQTRLLQDPGRCSGCRTCLTVCPTEALSVAEPAGWQSIVTGQLVSIAVEPSVRCKRCQVKFKDLEGRGLCPSCSFRRDHPFGSISPREMLTKLRDRAKN